MDRPFWFAPFMWGMTLIIAVIGVFLLRKGLGIRKVGKASLSWPKAPGRVESTAVQEGYGNDGQGNNYTYYVPQAKFTYAVSGNSYEGMRIAFKEYQLSSASKATTIVNKYPSGSSVQVSYNPVDPSESVLEAGSGTINSSLLNGAFVTLVALVFAIMLLIYLR